MPYVRKQARTFARKAGRGLLAQGAKYVRKRYTRPSGNVKYNKLVKEAAMAVSMLNAEKKYIEVPVNLFEVGQVNINATGARQFDVSPLMSQGTDVSTRNGNSIKLTSSFFQFQVSQQGTLSASPIKLSIELWKLKGKPLGAFANTATVAPATDLYDESIFSSVLDLTSTRNMDHFSDYQLIAKRMVYVKGDDVATTDIQTKTLTMPIKWNRGKGHHIRYQGTSNSSADIANGQIIMLFRCDVGNRGTTVSTASVPITGASTGLTVRMGYKHWYYDN